MINIKTKRLPHFKGESPSHASPNATTMDIKAQIVTERLLLPAGARAVIPTGLILEVPVGYKVELRSKGVNAASRGLLVLNDSPIDSTYKSEIFVLVSNASREAQVISDQEVIATMHISPALQMQLELDNVYDMFQIGAPKT